MVNRSEVCQKLTDLVNLKFKGSWQDAFQFYQVNDQIPENVLEKILSDAGIGYAISRPFIAGLILNTFDADGNKSISWAEFEKLAHI